MSNGNNVTLKQLVDDQKWNNMSDVQIIRDFFVLNDLEEDGINMIAALSKSKVSKLKHRERIVKEWVSYLPSDYLYKKYDLETATMLHNLELDYLSHGCELTNNRLEWAKENIPNIVMPRIYFRNLIDYLREKDIRFTDDKE